MPVSLNCKTCGKLFSVPPAQIRAGRKYCSRKCQNTIGAGNPNWKGGLVVSNCLVCGHETKVKKSHAEKGSGKFCSRKCVGLFNGKMLSERKNEKRICKKCVVCEKEIFIKPSHSEKSGTYCSHSCMANDYKERLKGANNPNWKDGISSIPGHYLNQRRCADGKYTILDIQNIGNSQKWKCINCKKIIKRKYHIDHIMPIALGGSNHAYNIQLLCPKCNLQKNAKHPIDWANKNGRLL